MDDASRLFEAAQEQVALGDLDSAEELLRQAVEFTDQPGLYTAVLACLLSMRERHDESLDILKEALEEEPNNAHLLVAAGMTFRGKQETVKAEKCFRMALEINPDHAAGLQQMAMLLADRGDLEEASELAIQAFGQLPHNPDLALTASDVLRLCGREQEAYEIIEQTATYRPDDLPTVEAAVEAALDLEHPERAWSLLRPVQSTHPRILTLKAVVLEQLGRSAEADKMLEALQPHEELQPDLIMHLAGLYLRREEFDLCQNLLDVLHAGEDKNSGTWRLQAQLELALGNTVAAAEYFRQAYLLTPSPDLAAQLALVLYTTGRFAEGVELCEAVVKEHYEAEPVWLYLVLFYAAQNRMDEALGAMAHTDPRAVLELLEGASLETTAELAIVPALQEFIAKWDAEHPEEEEEEEEAEPEAEGEARKPAVARPRNKRKKKKS